MAQDTGSPSSPKRKQKRLHPVSTRDRLVAGVGAFLLGILERTMRVRVEDRTGIANADVNPTPVVWMVWHNRILLLPPIARRRMKITRRAAVLTSASRDGALLAAFVGAFKLDAVRGSSSFRGTAAIRDMERVIESGRDVVITPDGPRGPVYQVSPGVAALASRTGVPVVPIRIVYRDHWSLRSWDKFQIPKPFSRAEITFHLPVRIPPNLAKEALDSECRRLERILLDDNGG